jgi:glycerol kinase
MLSRPLGSPGVGSAALTAVLAVDQGTSGTKALVVGPAGEVLGSAQVDVRPTYGDGGLVEVDPRELLDSVVEAGRAALADAGGVRVAAVGLANQGETVLAWDRTSGTPLSPAVVWQDRRSVDVCSRLGEHGARLAEITGLTLDPYFAAPKMAWLREHVTTDGVVTTSDAWLVHRLTGAFVTDASTASRTMLLDLDRCDWSAEAVATFGLTGEQLPKVVDVADTSGAVGVATAFGTELPVTGLMVDQQAALVGEGCLTAGTAKCTYGTGAFLLATTGPRARRSSSGLTASVAWRLGGEATYCLDGQVFTVASAVRWLVDVGVLSAADQLDAVGSQVDDCGGVTFVPALAGLGAPWWRADARGSLHGLGLQTEPGHLVRALVDGIAAQVAELVGAVAVDTGVALSTLRVDGGLTRSRLLMQAQADLLQTPVEVFASPDATALGVAAVARLALDPGLALADVVPMPSPAAVYDPVASADEAAERLGMFRSGLVL